MGLKAVLRIAYINHKLPEKKIICGPHDSAQEKVVSWLQKLTVKGLLNLRTPNLNNWRKHLL